MYLDIYRVGYFGVGEKLGSGKVFCLTYLVTSNSLRENSKSSVI